MTGRLGRALNALLLLEDTPERIALAFAIGVWIAFSPLLGIHTGLALGLAFVPGPSWSDFPLPIAGLEGSRARARGTRRPRW